MKYVFFFFMLIGCGKLDHRVSGDITVHHVIEFDVSRLEQFFTKYCNVIYVQQDDVDACVAEETKQFIEVFEVTK